MRLAVGPVRDHNLDRAGYTIFKLYIQRPKGQGRVMQVSKWGNSLAIRIPASVASALGLKEGDNVEVVVEGAKKMSIRKTAESRELFERVRKLRGKLPRDFRFDRLKANER